MLSPNFARAQYYEPHLLALQFKDTRDGAGYQSRKQRVRQPLAQSNDSMDAFTSQRSYKILQRYITLEPLPGRPATINHMLADSPLILTHQRLAFDWRDVLRLGVSIDSVYRVDLTRLDAAWPCRFRTG